MRPFIVLHYLFCSENGLLHSVFSVMSPVADSPQVFGACSCVRPIGEWDLVYFFIFVRECLQHGMCFAISTNYQWARCDVAHRNKPWGCEYWFRQRLEFACPPVRHNICSWPVGCVNPIPTVSGGIAKGFWKYNHTVMIPEAVARVKQYIYVRVRTRAHAYARRGCSRYVTDVTEM